MRKIEFIKDIMKSEDDNLGMELNNYYSILEENRLHWDKRSMEDAEVTDESEELAVLIVGDFCVADKYDASMFLFLTKCLAFAHTMLFNFIKKIIFRGSDSGYCKSYS